MAAISQPLSNFQNNENIPLADEDQIDDPNDCNRMSSEMSINSLSSSCTCTTTGSLSESHQNLEMDINAEEQEEKARLISQVLELQNTLDDLAQRVDSVKEENLKLRSENLVLGQYIENLMSASSVFQSTNATYKK